jgi:hypothetical protein
LVTTSSEESQFFAPEVRQEQAPAKLREFFLRADGFGLVEEPLSRFQGELGSRIPGIAVVEVELLFKDKLNGYHPNYAQDESYSVGCKRQNHRRTFSAFV